MDTSRNMQVSPLYSANLSDQYLTIVESFVQLFAFLDEVSREVNPAVLGTDKVGLKKRLGERLERIIPRGERQVKGEFQSA